MSLDVASGWLERVELRQMELLQRVGAGHHSGCDRRYVQRLSHGGVETVVRWRRLPSYLRLLPRGRLRDAVLHRRRLRPRQCRRQYQRNPFHEGNIGRARQTQRKVPTWGRLLLLLQDVITDLHAEAEPIPYHLHRHDWLGHKVTFNVELLMLSMEIQCGFTCGECD